MSRTIAAVFCGLLFLVGLLTVLLVSAEDASPEDSPPPSVTAEPPAEGLATTLAIEALQREVRHWQARFALRGQIIRRQRRSMHALIHARPWGNHWLERAFMCVHSGEGAWHSATGNGYFGGLQMDRSFMLTYGREFVHEWGWANNWPAVVQMTVAIRAWLAGRGFHPWPNTARECGLL